MLSVWPRLKYCRLVRILTLQVPNGKILDQTKLKAFADDNFNEAEMLFLSLIELKILWEQEKMLFTSIFSFSQNVF